MDYSLLNSDIIISKHFHVIDIVINQTLYLDRA